MTNWYALVTIASNGVKRAWGPCTRAEAKALQRKFEKQHKDDTRTVQYMTIKIQWPIEMD